jgi:hypothetical protein
MLCFLLYVSMLLCYIRSTCSYYVILMSYVRSTCSYYVILLRYDVAKLNNLDMKDAVQVQILDNILKNLPDDKLWDLADPTEAAYANMDLTRYHMTKRDLSSSSWQDIDSKSLTIEKDVSKKVAKESNSHLSEVVAVKFEHCKVVETLDLQPELLVSEKQLGKLVKDYKVIRALAAAKGNGSDPNHCQPTIAML